MTLKPLPGRVHVKPDLPPTETQGGIIIPPSHQDDIPIMSGTVIAVGEGDLDTQRKVTRIRAQAFRQCLEAVDEVSDMFRHTAELQVLREEIVRIMRLDPPEEHPVHVGDHVVFPPSCGQLVVFGEDMGGATLVLRESDPIAVVVEQEVAA